MKREIVAVSFYIDLYCFDGSLSVSICFTF